jgi:hypothetical protein
MVPAGGGELIAIVLSSLRPDQLTDNAFKIDICLQRG